MTTTIKCDLSEQLKKHYEGLSTAQEALVDVKNGLLLNDMLTIYAVNQVPKEAEGVNQLREVGEKRLHDIENKIEFHKLMIMLFNTFKAVMNGRSEQRVLGLVAEKVKEAIHNILHGIEELIEHDCYTEEDYLEISKGLMAEYKAWSPLCDPTATHLIVPCD